MSCGGQTDTNFYSRKPGSWLNKETEPTTDPNSAHCWTYGFYEDHCPSGWSVVGETTQGCNATTSRTSCRYANYPTDDKTLARCCLNAHKPGIMNANGQFPSDAKPCPINYCSANQDGTACKDAIEKYCSTQYEFGSEDNELCWDWAKKTGSVKLDEFCRDSGTAPGLAVIENKQCNDWINDTDSREYMDDAVSTYCATDISKKNIKEKGEKICACFEKNALLDDEAKRIVQLGAPLVCWNPACREYGYKTKQDVERINNCGHFCASANLIAVTGDVQGNISNQITCDVEATLQDAKKIKLEQDKLSKQIIEPKNNVRIIIAIVSIAFFAVILLVIMIIYFVHNNDKKKENYLEKKSQDFETQAENILYKK